MTELIRREPIEKVLENVRKAILGHQEMIKENPKDTVLVDHCNYIIERYRWFENMLCDGLDKAKFE